MTPLLSDSLRDCIKTIMEKHDSRIATDLYTADKYIETIRVIKRNSWTIGEENYQFLKDSIQKLIDGLITDEVRALSIRKDVFEIAFTPKGKDLVYTDTNTWSRENRQTGKPGRIIRKLLAFDYKERDIEIFNNLLKSEIMSTGDFDIVSGSDICHWYNQDNYFKIAGTLGNSCMKYESCSCYFRIYEDCAKLLICTKGDKLLGRAILWEIDGQTYMDRVYTCMDYLEEQFYQYAMDRGWTIRDNNGLLHDGDNMYWQEAKSSYKTGNELHLSIKLPELYDQFPYMDSFRYLIVDERILTDTVPDCNYISLSNTDGSWEDEEVFTCDHCGHQCRGEDYDDVCDQIHWSDYCEAYYCDDCCFYNSWTSDYLPNDIEVYDVHTNCGIEEVPEFEIDQHEWPYDEYCDYTRTKFIKIDGVWYTQDVLTWDEEENRYYYAN